MMENMSRCEDECQKQTVIGKMMVIMSLLLVPLVSGVERANFKVTCDGNFAIDPPEGEKTSK